MDEKNANDELNKAIDKHNVDLGVLIAETSVWANVEVHNYLKKENGKGSWRPLIRRAKSQEKRRTTVDGVFLDDNTFANKYLKTALGNSSKFINYEVCHIWPESCYNEYHHTTIANLVLLPRAIASLSDHNEGIMNILKYRCYKLYNWYPEGEKEPVLPENYPDNWSNPMPFTARIEKSLKSRKFV